MWRARRDADFHAFQIDGDCRADPLHRETTRESGYARERRISWSLACIRACVGAGHDIERRRSKAAIAPSKSTIETSSP
jgi:hypothetical protein